MSENEWAEINAMLSAKSASLDSDQTEAFDQLLPKLLPALISLRDSREENGLAVQKLGNEFIPPNGSKKDFEQFLAIKNTVDALVKEVLQQAGKLRSQTNVLVKKDGEPEGAKFCVQSSPGFSLPSLPPRSTGEDSRMRGQEFQGKQVPPTTMWRAQSARGIAKPLPQNEDWIEQYLDFTTTTTSTIDKNSASSSKPDSRSEEKGRGGFVTDCPIDYRRGINYSNEHRGARHRADYSRWRGQGREKMWSRNSNGFHQRHVANRNSYQPQREPRHRNSFPPSAAPCGYGMDSSTHQQGNPHRNEQLPRLRRSQPSASNTSSQVSAEANSSFMQPPRNESSSCSALGHRRCSKRTQPGEVDDRGIRDPVEEPRGGCGRKKSECEATSTDSDVVFLHGMDAKRRKVAFQETPTKAADKEHMLRDSISLAPLVSEGGGIDGMPSSFPYRADKPLEELPYCADRGILNFSVQESLSEESPVEDEVPTSDQWVPETIQATAVEALDSEATGSELMSETRLPLSGQGSKLMGEMAQTNSQLVHRTVFSALDRGLALPSHRLTTMNVKPVKPKKRVCFDLKRNTQRYFLIEKGKRLEPVRSDQGPDYNEKPMKKKKLLKCARTSRRSPPFNNSNRARVQSCIMRSLQQLFVDAEPSLSRWLVADSSLRYLDESILQNTLFTYLPGAAQPRALEEGLRSLQPQFNLECSYVFLAMGWDRWLSQWQQSIHNGEAPLGFIGEMLKWFKARHAETMCERDQVVYSLDSGEPIESMSIKYNLPPPTLVLITLPEVGNDADLRRSYNGDLRKEAHKLSDYSSAGLLTMLDWAELAKKSSTDNKCEKDAEILSILVDELCSGYGVLL